MPDLWSWIRGPVAGAVTLPDVVEGSYLNNLLPQVYDWTSHHLETVQLPSDLFGADWSAPVSRAGAMRVPAVARSRHLLCSAAAKMPLQAWRGDQLVDPGPYWTQGTDGQIGDVDADDRRRLGLWPQHPVDRMIWTVDDLLFHGRSLWYVTRFETVDGYARPTRLLRVPFQRWTFDDAGAVCDVDMQPIDQDRVRVILGAHEGLLTTGATTIRTAAELERNATDIASRPFRLELHQTTDVPLNDTEIANLIGSARRALADNNGILWTNSAVETKDHPISSEALMIAARNASALDIARHASIPGAMIDATSEGASLEYQTTETRGAQFVDYGLSLYCDPIAARLSMDDVVPARQSVRFDLAALTSPAISSPVTED